MAIDPGGAFEISLFNGDFFTNASNDDLNIRTMLQRQRILIGTNSNAPAAMVISSNSIHMNNNLFIYEKLGVGKCNLDISYPVDIVGNTAIDGSINATKNVLCRGVQIRKKTGGYYSAADLPTGVVQGFSNDDRGIVLYIPSNSSSNYFKFVASNNEIVRFTGDGRLSVGSSTPQATLHIEGDAYISSNITIGGDIKAVSNNIYNIGSSSNTFQNIFIGSNIYLGDGKITKASDSYMFRNSNDILVPLKASSLTLSNNGQATMYTSNSFIGIATPSPSYQLDVSGTFNASSIFEGASTLASKYAVSNIISPIAVSASNTAVAASNQAYTQWTSNSSNIYYGQTGNVGIGTISPAYKLSIVGDSYTAGLVRSSNGFYSEHRDAYLSANDGSNFGNWRVWSGSTTNTNGWDGFRFPTAEISMVCGSNSVKRSGFYYNGVGWALYVDENRTLYTPGDVVAFWSDQRLKTNFEEIRDYDHVLSSLTGYRFNWNDKGQKILSKSSNEIDVGLIAQDVQRVVPQAVKINMSGNSLDSPEEPLDYLTINYDKLIPFLIEGYKAQKSEITGMKKVIEEQSSEINALKVRMEEQLSEIKEKLSL